MENVISIREANPKENINLLSNLTFTWFINLSTRCIKERLRVQDLYRCLKSDNSNDLCATLANNWEKELKKAHDNVASKPRLLSAIRKTFMWQFLFFGLLQAVQFTIIFPLQPLLLVHFIEQFSKNFGEDKTNLFSMVASGGTIAGIAFILSFINNHITLSLSQLGMRVRIACCSLIYKKTLRLSQNALQKSTAGQIINMLSNDVNRFDLVAFFINHIWIMPIQVGFITFLIWKEVQLAAVIGIGIFILLTIPVNAIFGKIMSVLRLNVAKKTDNRVKIIAEIISGIQIIKMYAWEKSFAAVAHDARILEMNVISWASYLKGVITSIYVFMQRTIIFLTSVLYVVFGNTLTSAKIFSVLQYFNIVQFSLGIFFPLAITLGAETLISINRLEEFLLQEEKTEPSIEENRSKSIVLQNVYASWKSKENVLKNLNFDIQAETLCTVVGPVGAGKSSLLQLIIGELVQSKGTVHIGGSISYASQEPWLFASTVRKNILFGQKFVKSRYDQVVRSCALDKDFLLLPYGDKTMVGDKGISLSGGQKARINLARTVYKDADIYILDDPLSAVDTQVGKHLFENCVQQLLEKKTRILVTHQLQYLSNADSLIFLDKGEIKIKGTYAQLMQHNQFAKELNQIIIPEKSETQNNNIANVQSIENCTPENQIIPKNITEKVEESFETDTSTYILLWEFAKSGGSTCSLILFLLLTIFSQIVCIITDLWLTWWTQNANTQSEFNNTQTDQQIFNITYSSLKTSNLDYQPIFKNNNTVIYIYTALVCLSIALVLCRSIYFFAIITRASKNLHYSMFTSLLLSPMKFFNINPAGRILNRVSRDIGTIDEILPRMILEAIQITFMTISIFVLVIISNPYMIIITVVLGYVFNNLCQRYLITARNLKHLEGISKSLVFSHLSATINGITTIRSSRAENILTKEFDAHQDTHTATWYLTLICTGAFGLWIDLISFLYIFFLTFSFIGLSQYTRISDSYVGLAMSQSLALCGSVQYGVLQFAQVVGHLTSVERVLEYTKLEKEESAVSDDTISSTWPTNGQITFLNVSMKYSEYDNAVLKNLNFTIENGQKIGIVGRTGAGKSSLVNALFRLAPIDGTVLIDGIDTTSITLNKLRSKISIIPQDPVLFSASLRINLDPFNEFSDELLWQALKDVELKPEISSLDYVVEEGGKNFSVGQRQLLCLARAILRKNKILVLDEATANVDPKTDELIQDTIRIKFKACTVLTIAHRLHTIMDSDRVMVLDKGILVEFDHPYKLLINPKSLFTQMVSQTGSAMSVHLKNMAEKFYLKSNQVENTRL